MQKRVANSVQQVQSASICRYGELKNDTCKSKDEDGPLFIPHLEVRNTFIMYIYSSGALL